MNAEGLVIAFKRDMAKLSGTERSRAIESVRDVISAAAFDDAAGSAYEVERSRVCLKTAYTMRHRLIERLSAYSPSLKTGRGCGCELDETYFPESFKGKGNRAKGLFAMPHRQHRDGMSISSLLALNTMYRVHFLMPYKEYMRRLNS